MKRIYRNRRLTPEEAARYNEIREKIKQEFPPAKMEPRMDKIKYITDGGVACPKCGSHNITGENLDWDEPLTQSVNCNECGASWKETLRPMDILMPDGSEIKPEICPIHQIFDWTWIGVVQKGTLEIHGPFATTKIAEARKRLDATLQVEVDDESRGGGLVSTPKMFEIQLSPTGALFPVEFEIDSSSPTPNS